MSTTLPKDLLTEFGLEALPEAEREELLRSIAEVVYEGVLRKAWNGLDVKRQKELFALVEACGDDPHDPAAQQAVEAYLRTNVPEYEQLLAREFEEFRSTQQQIYGEITS